MVTDSSAASKVAQVQELMRQRLQAVQEEQQRQWHEIQLALNSQLQGAQQAAQEAVKRELQEVLQNQQAEVQALRRAMADLMQAQQVQEDRHADALQSQLNEARSALQRVEAEAQQQLRSCQQHMEVGHHHPRGAMLTCFSRNVLLRDGSSAFLSVCQEQRQQMQRLQLQNEEIQQRQQQQNQEREPLYKV